MSNPAKPITPYQRLLNDIVKFCCRVNFRHRTMMWCYPKEKLASVQWSLFDLNERVKAAEQLGYDVVLESKDDGLHVYYVKKLPETPPQWR